MVLATSACRCRRNHSAPCWIGPEDLTLGLLLGHVQDTGMGPREHTDLLGEGKARGAARRHTGSGGFFAQLTASIELVDHIVLCHRHAGGPQREPRPLNGESAGAMARVAAAIEDVVV